MCVCVCSGCYFSVWFVCLNVDVVFVFVLFLLLFCFCFGGMGMVAGGGGGGGVPDAPGIDVYMYL